MRFSDMMGERSLPSENDTAVTDALAPYVDEPVTAEIAVAVDAEPATPAPKPPIVGSGHDTLAAMPPTVGSIFAVISGPVEALAPANDPTADAIADFTPLSDDLLPRRKR
jgi:anti-sigma factor RsiW